MIEFYINLIERITTYDYGNGPTITIKNNLESRLKGGPIEITPSENHDINNYTYQFESLVGSGSFGLVFKVTGPLNTFRLTLTNRYHPHTTASTGAMNTLEMMGPATRQDILSRDARIVIKQKGSTFQKCDATGSQTPNIQRIELVHNSEHDMQLYGDPHNAIEIEYKRRFMTTTLKQIKIDAASRKLLNCWEEKKKWKEEITQYAVKTSFDPDSRANLERERQVLNLVQGQPYLLQMYDYSTPQVPGTELSEFEIVTEWCDQDLFSMIDEMENRGRTFPDSAVKSIMTQVLTGIQALHTLGYCHLDLKPDNIFIKKKGNLDICIGDFGLALPVRTQIMSTIGTENYMAPEIVASESSPVTITEKQDVFSIGCICVEMLTFNNCCVNGSVSEKTIRKINDMSDKKKNLCIGLLDPQSEERITVHNALKQLQAW